MKITVKPINSTQTVDRVTNHVIIYDRSQSMYYTLPGLIRDLRSHKTLLKVGDTLSVAWFSTENGQFNFVLKGHTINHSTYGFIDQVLDRNSTTIGLTCFSEVLKATEQVIEDLKVFSPHFTLHFFTDGYPVVSNYQKEERGIFEAIKNLAPYLDSVLLVGYGDWYNRELMARMAKSFNNATLIHSSSLEEYHNQAEAYFESLEPTIEIEVEKDKIVFSISTEGLVTIHNSSEGRIKVSQSTKEVYLESEEGLPPPDDYSAYAGRAILALQEGDVGKALEAMAETGDVLALDKISNAFTVQEIGETINLLQELIIAPRMRYQEGQDNHYLPQEDAFCVLDLLELLQADSKALFYPYHPQFEYKRTGVPKKQLEGYPEFIKSEKSPGVELSHLVWHESRANISIQCRVEGVVNLGEEASKYDLSSHYYTHIFRNFTLIKDGTLNITKLPVSTTRKTYQLLREKSLVDRVWEADKPYMVDLTLIPLINRKMASQYTDARLLTAHIKELTEIKAALKVFNYYLKKIRPEKPFSQTLNKEQETFLREKGVKAYGFSPPTEKQDIEDYYLAKEFEVQYIGHVSLPKIEDVITKWESGKGLTPVQEMLYTYIYQYETDIKGHAEEENLLLEKISKWEERKAKLQPYIERTKFAVIVGKSWFSEIPGREGEFNDCKFILKETKVAF